MIGKSTTVEFMSLAENLIHYSRKKGLTIAALAKSSGVKQPTLHGWTTGRSVKKIDDLKKVCSVLEVGLHTMLYGVRDPFEQDSATFDLRITVEKVAR